MTQPNPTPGVDDQNKARTDAKPVEASNAATSGTNRADPNAGGSRSPGSLPAQAPAGDEKRPLVPSTAPGQTKPVAPVQPTVMSTPEAVAPKPPGDAGPKS